MIACFARPAAAVRKCGEYDEVPPHQTLQWSACSVAIATAVVAVAVPRPRTPPPRRARRARTRRAPPARRRPLGTRAQGSLSPPHLVPGLRTRTVPARTTRDAACTCRRARVRSRPALRRPINRTARDGPSGRRRRCRCRSFRQRSSSSTTTTPTATCSPGSSRAEGFHGGHRDAPAPRRSSACARGGPTWCCST